MKLGCCRWDTKPVAGETLETRSSGDTKCKFLENSRCLRAVVAKVANTVKPIESSSVFPPQPFVGDV